ncbi:WGR domain-containing protein [Noviherbaspirillum aridicola]|uniref:WGR domain-containing protein n=1 Tax=Noviherbaspirillum aridicola TaxID=2849687 RepID=A0ABQ4Q4H0_9BURK|nr:WGR domain-containing protein [Noviherbaspirillum aridicola]GIZ51988.1 hypothetical protein NCCP691_20020 [Noviherbaspirillum aridicola]
MIDPADSVTLALPQPTRVRFVAGSRVHTATLDQDLFGDWTLTQSWSGPHGSRGGGRITRVASFEAGMALMQALVRKLGKDGYRLAP